VLALLSHSLSYLHRYRLLFSCPRALLSGL